MKKIKRTTIKIRRRELVILKSGERSGGGEEIIQICPVCNSPVSNQLDEHEKSMTKFLAEKKN